MRAPSAVFSCLLTAGALPAAELPPLLFSPAQPTDSDVVRVTVLGESARACGASFYPQTDVAARRVTLTGYGADPPPGGCPTPAWTSEATLGFVAAGEWEVEATLNGAAFGSARLFVAPSPTRVSLGGFGYFETHFDVEIDWRDPWAGALWHAPGSALSDRAAQFWFFDPGTPEVTVKILDGNAVNGHHWLFASSMTSVEFTLRIIPCVEGDPPFCMTPKEYHSAAGSNLDIADVEALP